jgi:rfaE bifunctional protein kinase chain/domain
MKPVYLNKTEIDKFKISLIEKLPNLSKGKLLVIGDICLDEYLMGEVKRISPEAPVPVLDVKNQESRLGLTANVAQNVVSLGGKCHLIGVVGDDITAEHLCNYLKMANVNTEGLIVDKDRPTTKKTRLMAGNHHIVRVDFEKRKFLSDEIREQLLEKAKFYMPKVDVVVLEDYAKGVFCEKTTQSLIKLAHQNNKKVFVDPHRSTPVHYYRGADVIKPNKDEAYILSGLNIDELRDDEESLERVAKSIQQLTGCEHLVITLGKDGMVNYSGNEFFALPTEAKQTFDVTGAGDTVLATLSLALASGFNLNEACILSNSAAGVVVGKVGCVPCHYSELHSEMTS